MYSLLYEKTNVAVIYYLGRKLRFPKLRMYPKSPSLVRGKKRSRSQCLWCIVLEFIVQQYNLIPNLDSRSWKLYNHNLRPRSLVDQPRSQVQDGSTSVPGRGWYDLDPKSGAATLPSQFQAGKTSVPGPRGSTST